MLVHNCLSIPVRRLAHCALAAVLAVGAGAAAAGEAGRIVFVSGEARAGAKAATLGEAVREGDELSTGKDGYIYLKTVDDGLLILRPASRARIDAYHIDGNNPANTRVKLELLSGVARSVSGKGVKAARQNFRFNTPVAAIGVRGTDFTVFTDQQTSNVTVLDGAIVVSGFGGTCSPGGAGPCEHAASRELAAGQMGQMLQVRRGQAEPKLMSAGSVAPNVVAPPRADEPVAKGGGATPAANAADASLDPLKADSLLHQVARANVAPSEPQSPPTLPSDPLPPVTVEVTAPKPEVPPLPDSKIVWGRWAAVAGNGVNVDADVMTAAGAQRVATNKYYSIYRTKGADWQTPVQGSAGFALRQGEAAVLHDATGVISAATMENGKLLVDFSTASFATSFDLLTGQERFNLKAVGSVARNGQLGGSAVNYGNTNMSVNGTLGSQNDAAYLFYSRLDAARSVNGVTYWTK
ncbi:FecR family protein [Duganella sp. CF517]|uniref:FecR family protein n=1 Tax=Duganella sp. CF517 TaxID=1881038 RepID=UPI0008D2E005|nr:FecR family protein [Duganella sp. CF517]SEO21036.1 FecR family protein [Duganella sp. CF517]